MKNIYVFVIISVLFISCSYGKKIVSLNKNKQNKRTILVYLGGDNSLSLEVDDKIEYIKKGWNKSLGELVIFADVSTKTKPVLLRLREENNKVYADTIKSYGNDNSASSTLLKRVIEDTQNIAPSLNYGMILFSHATGWLPANAFEKPKNWHSTIKTYSIFKDKTRQMELNDFVDAIPNNMFDFLVFDTCFMAGAETTYALRNKTKYIVASSAEILSPGFLKTYSTSLNKLYLKKPNLVGFAKDFYNFFEKKKGPYRSATISVLNTYFMKQLAKEVSEIPFRNITKAELNKLQFFDRKTPHLFFDFKDYYNLLLPNLKKTKFNKILNEVVVYKANTSKLINIYINKHSGLTVYIPQPELPLLNNAYKTTEWFKVTNK
ncbi:MAG: hypothetical protein KGV59_04165 [Tenacibaculum sp.]|nr:hypothetical protein [Tenacibaculum sp.]